MRVGLECYDANEVGTIEQQQKEMKMMQHRLIHHLFKSLNGHETQEWYGILLLWTTERLNIFCWNINCLETSYKLHFCSENLLYIIVKFL